jgi:hypothetical protein
MKKTVSVTFELVPAKGVKLNLRRVKSLVRAYIKKMELMTDWRDGQYLWCETYTYPSKIKIEVKNAEA